MLTYIKHRINQPACSYQLYVRPVCNRALFSIPTPGHHDSSRRQRLLVYSFGIGSCKCAVFGGS